MVRRKINGEIHLHSCDLMKMTRFVWIFSSVSLLFVAVLHFAALLYLALLFFPSFVKTNVRISAAKLRCTHSWRAEEKHIYISIFFFSSWKTRQHLYGFSSRTSLHICTRRLEFFYFPRFVPRNDFPPLNERVNFARDALFAYHRALPVFFCSRTRQGLSHSFSNSNLWTCSARSAAFIPVAQPWIPRRDPNPFLFRIFPRRLRLPFAANCEGLSVVYQLL